MTRETIDGLVEKYAQAEGLVAEETRWSTQYDDRSASINYSLIRHFKPKVAVEFGSFRGRCTHDILQALMVNKKENGGDFIFKSYEIDEKLRKESQELLDSRFGKGIITIGGDVMVATDIPDNIEYLFVDNCHDLLTTEWVFNSLLKKCKKGCLVQIHDLPITGDFEIDPKANFPETFYMKDLYDLKKLPLKKVYFAYEEGRSEATWWNYL